MQKCLNSDPKIRQVLGVITILALSTVAGRCAESFKQQETELLTEFKRDQNGETLLQLAFLREKHEHLEEAIATWNLAKKLWGNKQISRDSSAPTQSWSKTADFFIHRLRRKINLRSSSPRLGPQMRRQIAAAAMSFGDEPPVDQIDLSVQADLDGDMIDELFYIGRDGPLGRRTKKSMGIAKWDGRKYKIVWRTEKAIPIMVDVVDEDGDGWKEITCGYQPDTDDAATLYFNGKEAMFL